MSGIHDDGFDGFRLLGDDGNTWEQEKAGLDKEPKRFLDHFHFGFLVKVKGYGFHIK
jgi:hypothetical protein